MTQQVFSGLLQQARQGDESSLGILVAYMTNQGLTEAQQESVLYDDALDRLRFTE